MADAERAAEAGEIWLLLDSGGVGGVETHVRALYLAFRRAGARARIVLLQDNGRNPWLEQLAAIDATPMILDGGLQAITRALSAHRPSVLHTHGYKAGILGRLAARLTGAPVVSSFHAGERAPGKVGLYQRVDEWSSFLAKRIAVSAPIQAHLPFKSALIPNFIATPDAPPTAPLPPVVAFVGRLSAEKGPDLFCRLAAAHAAAAPSSGLEWRVYGDGAMRAELEAAYGDRVRFYGVVANMPDVWPEIGLLAMTSRAEGLPMAALEAGAAGVPILATRVGALPEVIDEDATGWLLELDRLESGDFAPALAALERWSAARADGGGALRDRAWSKVRRAYSEDQALARIRAVYQEAGAVLSA